MLNGNAWAALCGCASSCVSQFKSKRSKANERIQVWHFPGSDAALFRVPVPGGRGAFQVWIQRAVSGWRKKQIKEQEQMKPTAWYDPSNGVVSTDQDCPLFTPLGQVWPLYPKGEWVGLTDEQVNEYNYLGPDMPWVVREVAAILKERNQ